MGWGGGTHKFSMGNFKFVRSLDYTYELRKQARAFFEEKRLSARTQNGRGTSHRVFLLKCALWIRHSSYVDTRSHYF